MINALGNEPAPIVWLDEQINPSLPPGMRQDVAAALADKPIKGFARRAKTASNKSAGEPGEENSPVGISFEHVKSDTVRTPC